MKLLSRYVEALRLGAVIDSKAPAGGAKAGTSVVLPVYEFINLQLTASSASVSAYVLDNVSGQFVIEGVTTAFGVASTSGTVQVEVATGTQAVASGTNQLTAPLALSGTANSASNGTLIASPTTISAGNRVNVIIAGTMTNLVNGVVTIVLRRVA